MYVTWGHVELDMTWRLNTYMYVMYLCYGKEIDEKTSLSLDLGNCHMVVGTRTAFNGAPCSLQTLLY